MKRLKRIATKIKQVIMDVKEVMGQLTKISNQSTNVDHRVSAYSFIKLVDGKLPYAEERLMKFINKAQEHLNKTER